MDESSKESSGERQSQEPEAAKLTNEKPNETPAGEIPAGVPASTTPANEAGASGDASPEAHAHGAAGESMLPVVWSPKLGGDEVSQIGRRTLCIPQPAKACTRPAKRRRTKRLHLPAPMVRGSSRSVRVAMVAVSLAAAAAVGSFIGSLSATGVEHFWPAPATNAATAHNAPATKAEPGRRVGAESQSRCGDAWRQRPVGQARRASRPSRARSGRACGEACPHRRSARSAREENRDCCRIRRRCSGDNRHHPERRAGGKRSEVVRQSAAGLDRARSARRPGADREPPWRHV